MSLALSIATAPVGWLGYATAPLTTIRSTNDLVSFSVSGLPTGISVSAVNAREWRLVGTPSAAGGFACVATGSDSVTTVTLDFTIQILAPALALSVSPEPRGFVGEALAIFNPARSIGGAVAATAWTFTGLPAGLTGNNGNGQITGTPTTAGSSSVTVTTTNGTESDSLTYPFFIAAYGFTLSSAPLAPVAEEYFVLYTTGTSGSTGATFEANGLPASVSMAPGGGYIEGTLPAGDYVFEIQGIKSGVITAIEVPLFVSPAIAVAPVIDGEVGVIMYHTATPLSGGTYSVELSGGPPGVAPTLSGSFYGGQIAGIPSEPGIFYATLTKILVDGGSTYLTQSVPVTFRISGGNFLNWFHEDALRRDLQINLRTREVAHVLSPAPWTLIRGEKNIWLGVIFRDAKEVIDADLAATAVRLTVRPVDDFDGAAYLDHSFTSAVAIHGHSVWRHLFDATSAAIEEAFAALDDAPGGSVASASLVAIGQLTWTHPDGRILSTRTFPAVILQDATR